MTSPTVAMSGPDVPAIDFRVLGPLEVKVGGTALVIGGPKQRAVLAALLVNRNHAVSWEALGTAVWDEEPPAAFQGSLQVSVSSLRRALKPTADRTGPILETVSPGYRLNVSEDSYDLARFRAIRSSGMEHLAAGRFERAAVELANALGQWRGGALDDLPRFRFAREFAVSMEEERLATLHSRIEADLACGRQSGLLAELTELTRRYPLREPFWAQLITALYQVGRQADALECLRRLREVLADELGIDPSRPLQELEGQVLRQEVAAPRFGASPVGREMLATVTEMAGGSSKGGLIGRSGELMPILSHGLRIGRSPDNDLVIADSKVSRQHAAIIDTGSEFVITDLRSTNGISVNGSRVVESKVLAHGDVVRIATTEVTFVLSA